MKTRHSWTTLLRAALVLALAVGAAALPPGAALGATTSHARVAIIVGPVGSLTDDYRAMANAAAARARRYSDNVVTVYSPDATWPAVRRALTGASIVVYLGHGNGWPSPYSDTPKPQTQNGLGLNPVAGKGDSAHQYFGERYLAQAVRLAPGAVVLLHHLCYASGAAEPGMAQPDLDTAVQRVDNFGAGWLAAGADAVIAEAHGAPAYYIDALFRRRGTIEAMWRSNPNFHDHVLAADSVRTSGARLLLDPNKATTGFYRSIVLRPGATTSAMLAGVATVRTLGTSSETRPSGSAWATPVKLDLPGPVIAGSTAKLTLTFEKGGRAALPAKMVIGARWDPLLVDDAAPPAPAATASAAPSAAPSSPAPSVAPASAAPSVAPPQAASVIPPPQAASVAPSPQPASVIPPPLPEPPDVVLVAPETAGSLVVTAPAAGRARVRTVRVTIPDVPGLYRLVTTLHDKDGVALDAASQDLVPALIVRVTGRLWATYGLPAQITATAGEGLVLPVRIANSGSDPWAIRPTGDSITPGTGWPGGLARLVGRWVALEGIGPASGVGSDVSMAADVEPGGSVVLGLPLAAPTVAGTYLLVLDIALPDGRSLAGSGVPPGLVRVTVGPAAPASVEGSVSGSVPGAGPVAPPPVEGSGPAAVPPSAEGSGPAVAPVQ